MNERMKLLSSIISKLRAALPEGEAALWQAFIKAMSEAFRCEAASYFKADTEHRTLTLQYALGVCAGEVTDMTIGYEGVVGSAAINLKPIIANDVSKSPEFCDKLDKSTGFQTRAVLCAPVINTGELMGVIELINPQSGSFTDADMELAGFLCLSVARAISEMRNSP
ncbi:MAG: GAF domain-containing protein [Elusimicrobiales bacterium]